MIHPSSGFRGTRAGVTEGTGFSFESEDHGKPLPRIRVSYWCAKGHETTPVFLKLPEDQIPLVWDCRKCGGPASRDGEAAAADALDDGYKSHLEYVKERRCRHGPPDVPGGAGGKRRPPGGRPDELLGDT